MAKTKNTKPPVVSNAIGEWFGVRLYPESHCEREHLQRFKSKECPFLSAAFARQTSCIKAENSVGVCTITSANRGDWMVCPYRAIDHSFLVASVHQLFSIEIGIEPNVQAAPLFGTERNLQELHEHGGDVFVYFQDKLGGEISLQPTSASPEISFDLTFVRLRPEGDNLVMQDWAILELQTMDFHGSYKHAVGALRQALNLFPESFHEEVKRNPEWLSRNIEGPNIANVFKRTFYQLLVKFSLVGHGGCRGAILALPSAVWESWRPHLGGLVESRDGSDYVFGQSGTGNTWVYLFEFTSFAISIVRRICVETKSLQTAAFTTAANNLGRHSAATIKDTIAQRLNRINHKIRVV
jgi:hypothetical protein